MRRSDLLFLLALILTVAAVAGGLWYGETAGDRTRPAAAAAPAAQESGPAIGGPFTLTDQFGARVTESDLLGHWTVVYFGYTFCPDVCPVTLNDITRAVDELGARGDKVVPMFITVDPKRDTGEGLRKYAEHFHPRLRFLTGSEEEVQQAAAVYRVYRAFREEEPGDPNYLVDHTSIVYVMGPNGKYATHFSHGTPVTEMVERLRRLL